MKKTIIKIFSPIRYFINDSRAVGIVLIVSTIVSLFLANSFIGTGYRNFWVNEMHASASLHLPANYLEWINNFLMGIFFLMAGTEIKRELMEGELSSFKKAVLPFGAALGGMLVPALIFLAFNLNTHFIRGWGVPTATDIAFSLGVASLLGKKVPLNLKILLMALAIIDDLGAIVVIAFFYGGQIHWVYLAIAALICGGLLACLYFKIKFGVLQITLAICLWYVFLQTGIEASISGVLFAFAVPVNKLVAVEKFIHNFVNFFVLPLFALANTALFIPSDFSAALSTPLSLGIMVGLVVGKPLGIFFSCYILVSFNIAKLPTNIRWKQILGMGTLAGIGFTMSIFTTMLAFNEAAARDIARVSILLSVTVSAIASILYFHRLGFEPLGHTKSIVKKKPELQLSPA
jgi:Na+:H+ antiporter, NhaA family